MIKQATIVTLLLSSAKAMQCTLNAISLSQLFPCVGLNYCITVLEILFAMALLLSIRPSLALASSAEILENPFLR